MFPPNSFQILCTSLLTQLYVFFLSFKKNKKRNNSQKHNNENQINRKRIKQKMTYAHTPMCT